MQSLNEHQITRNNQKKNASLLGFEFSSLFICILTFMKHSTLLFFLQQSRFRLYSHPTSAQVPVHSVVYYINDVTCMFLSSVTVRGEINLNKYVS